MNLDSDGFSPGFCEYLVPGFASKRIVIIRILSIVLGVVLLSLLFQLLSFIPQVFAVWFVLICALEVAIFRFTVREFEYTVAMGELTVEVIYGKKWRRKLANLRITDIDKVFPVSGFKDEKISKLKADKVIYASTKKSDFMYCLFMKEGGKNSKCALVFSSCKKLTDALKFYNRSALSKI